MSRITAPWLVTALGCFALAQIPAETQFSARADNTIGSTSGLRAGEKISVRELWKTTHELLDVEGFSGVKIGTTTAAGACWVAVGERADDKRMAVVLGSSSSAARYADSRNLFRWPAPTRVGK